MDLKDKLLRTLADMENLRRRTEREVADARTYAVTNFARDILAVADNMDRALKALDDELQRRRLSMDDEFFISEHAWRDGGAAGRLSVTERFSSDLETLRFGAPRLAILVDYDGTIALTDVSDTVMAEHVPAIWESEAAAYDAVVIRSTWDYFDRPAEFLAWVDRVGPIARRFVNPPELVVYGESLGAWASQNVFREGAAEATERWFAGPMHSTAIELQSDHPARYPAAGGAWRQLCSNCRAVKHMAPVRLAD